LDAVTLAAGTVLLVWILTGQLVGSSDAEPTAVTLAAAVAVALAALAALDVASVLAALGTASTAKRLLPWTKGALVASAPVAMHARQTHSSVK
jgi:hypothetical protein